LSAAKTATKKTTWPTHGRGRTSAAYHGSKVVRSARSARKARKGAFTEVRVVAAQ
jgi:hypothetical protein